VDSVKLMRDHDALFVEVSSGDLNGLGQSTYDGDMDHTLSDLTESWVMEHVMGIEFQNLSDIDAITEHIWREEYKHTGTMLAQAIAGVDSAMWDLLAKSQGKSVCALLAAELGTECRSHVPAYASNGVREKSAKDIVANAVKYQKDYGFTAFKFEIAARMGHDVDQTPGRTEELIPLARQQLGPEAVLLVDANGGYDDLEHAKIVGQLLVDNNYSFYEEPFAFWEYDKVQQVRDALPGISLATGECEFRLGVWQQNIHAMSIVQPDVHYIGGPSRTLRVARMAMDAGGKISPHSSTGGLVTVMALNIMGAVPNAWDYMELNSLKSGPPGRGSFTHHVLEVEDGKIEVPTEPGWGVGFEDGYLSKATNVTCTGSGGRRRRVSVTCSESVSSELSQAEDQAPLRVTNVFAPFSSPLPAVTEVKTYMHDHIVFVRVKAGDLEGWGQATYDKTGLDSVIAKRVHDWISPYVLGKSISSPTDIEQFADEAWRQNYKHTGTVLAQTLAGVDTALWDLVARSQNRSVCSLIASVMGGECKIHMPVYGSNGNREKSPEEIVGNAVYNRDTYGVRAFKFQIAQRMGGDVDIEPGRTQKLIPLARQQLGPDVTLLADANGGYDTPEVAEPIAQLLLENNFTWFEEPYPFWEYDKAAALGQKVPTMHIALGEQEYRLDAWQMNIHAMTFAQPDVHYIGGVSRTLSVARMSMDAGSTFVPHSPNPSMVDVFALSMLAAVPNAFEFMEFDAVNTRTPPDGTKFFTEKVFAIENGMLTVPTGPGWGVTVRQDWLDDAETETSSAKFVLV
jgi:L-alanine-DL-glutamate epimerase-like enolase superfamily enzyme